MNIDNLMSVSDIEAFLNGSQAIAFSVASSKDERYAFIERILKRFGYARLKRQEKGVVIKFLQKVSGYSRQQITRHIQRFTVTGKLKREQKTTNGFERFYTEEDKRLLAELDKRHDTPNGAMVRTLCQRAYHHFGELEYERLSKISVSHLYNLRDSVGYKKYRCHYEKTRSKSKGANIGERRKPNNEGKPGYIRIDTVHQGDYDGEKGVYHINAVDEMTQFEIVVSVEKISEAYLIPALELLLAEFPFVIINFHSDNGSEYVNHTVAKLLKKLLIDFTKSRPRKSNDNALPEGKNASVVRKTFGYSHIPQYFAEQINQFNLNVLNPYVNYHRPCLYATTMIDHKGKVKKTYNPKDVMTPYDKLKSLPDAEQYLRDNLNFKILDDIAFAITDNEAAERLQRERKRLFNIIHEGCQKRA